MNPHDWHKRPADCSDEGPCTVCGCPAAGTRKTGTYHRATLETEGFSFRFIIRKPSANHYINPTSIVGAVLDAMPQPFGAATP